MSVWTNEVSVASDFDHTYSAEMLKTLEVKSTKSDDFGQRFAEQISPNEFLCEFLGPLYAYVSEAWILYLNAGCSNCNWVAYTGTRRMMEIQMLLMLLAASWLCCDAVSIDYKTRLYHDLLRDHREDVQPPLPEGVANITAKMAVYLRCATPGDDGLVLIESTTLEVSRP